MQPGLSFFKTALILLAATALLLLPGTGTLPLMDRDEPRFAQAAWEMMERGDYVVPHFNGEYRFDKPPLIYWWMIPHYALLGKTELAARLPSVEASWLTACLIALLGRRLYSPRAGLLAGLTWLASLQVMIHGRLAVADMAMMVFVTLTYAALIVLLTQRQITPAALWRWRIILGIALGLGFLAKGPVAWAVPLLGLLMTRWFWWRKPLPWGRLGLEVAMPLAVIIVAAWGLPANWRTDWAYWGVGIGTHVVERGMGALNGRFYLPGVYYLGTMFISLFPWCFFIPAALARTGEEMQETMEPGEGKRADDSRLHHALLMGWFVAPFLIFSFYKTQLPHYILPGFPAFFLLLARSGRLPEFITKFQRRWFGATAGVFAVVIAGLFCAWAFLPWPSSEGLLKAVLYAGFLLASLFLLGCYARRGAGAWLVAGCWIAFGMSGLCSHIKSVHPVMALLHALKTLPADTESAMSGFTEPSIVFYHGGRWLYGNLKKTNKALPNFNKPVEAFKWLSQTASGKTRALLLSTKGWTLQDYPKEWQAGRGANPHASEQVDPQWLEGAIQNLGYPAERRVSGYNAARSTWEELILLVKKG